MCILISPNVVFVSGAYNGAIYDFNKNRLFAVNHDANLFLKRLVQGGYAESTEEKEYYSLLINNKLLEHGYPFREYIPQGNISTKLNFAWLEVTQMCNLRCIHCYEGEAHNVSIYRLSLLEWKRILKELSEAGCSHIQFIGGEPSYCPYIIDLIDEAGSLKFKTITFFTNCTNISDDLVKCLKRNNVLIKVSIYGHTAAIHDKITSVKGSFNNTINNIKMLQQNSISVSAVVTIMFENELYYENIIQFIHELGIQFDKFDLVREVSGCKQNCKLVSRKDLIEKKYRTKPKFSISKEWFDKSVTQNTCWYGKFAIAENGDVFPCVFERKIIYGNLKNMTVCEVLNSSVVKNYWRMDFSKIDECNECEFRFACKDCRPLGELNGNITKKNIRCLYHPRTGEWK